MNEAIDQALVHAFALAIPEMVLGLAACVLFIGATYRTGRHVWGAVALAGIIAAAIALICSPPPPDTGSPASASLMFASPLFLDHLGLLIKVVALVGGAVLVLLSWNEVPDRQAAEYHGCLLLAIAGLSLTGAANELITLFLALELISIPTYILLYLPRFDDAAHEAAMKYFLLSVFSSALLLFGFSYLYGLAGTTNVPALIEAFTRSDASQLPAVALIALVMVVAGLGFRMTIVPFHYYAPDVYQGAPTGAAAVLAFVPKLSGFVALLRVLGLVSAGVAGNGLALGDQVPILFWILAAVTMTLGNVLALLQNNIKRLLAYSSVAHAGYMLIGIAIAYPLSLSGAVASSPGAVPAVIFYLVAYAAMTVGAFAVLDYLSTTNRRVETEDDLAGLSQSHPGIALLMAIFLFSLIGIPLTAGFAGKLLLFWGAMAERGGYGSLFRWLALIGVLNAAVGAYYYLRILARMYLHSPVRPLARPRNYAGLTALWICGIVTVVLGVYPDPLVRAANRAAGRAQHVTAPVVTAADADTSK
jgi:NADH-quinone oxidoreductase subunit N